MAIINKEELNKSLERLSLYKTEEDINLSTLNSKLNNLSNLYTTNNTDKFKNLNLELSEKYKVLSNIHNNYTIIIQKSIKKYEFLSTQTEKDFSNITGENE